MPKKEEKKLGIEEKSDKYRKCNSKTWRAADYTWRSVCTLWRGYKVGETGKWGNSSCRETDGDTVGGYKRWIRTI